MLLHGRRKVLELQKCSSFRSVVNPLQNAFPFSSSAQDGRKGKNFTVDYLTDSLGLTTKLAESISKKVEDKGNAESVLSLLKSHGITDSHISSIITGYPQLLRLDAENSLAPKLKFLQSRGASSSDLTETLSKLPSIFGLKWDRSISVYYDFVKEVLEADKSYEHIKLCHSLPQGGNQENILRNVSALKDLGVPQKLLFSLLVSTIRTCSVKEKFETSLKKVVGFGFDPTTPSFIRALCTVAGLREERIEEKVNVYKKLGLGVEDIRAMIKWSPEALTVSEKKITHKFEILKNCGLVKQEILSVFKNYPQIVSLSEHKLMNSIKTFLGLGFSRDEFAMIVTKFPGCLGYSAESLKKKIEFVVKKMKWPLKAVVSVPPVLGYSLEKRTIPRCNVIKALMAKGLIGDQLPPLTSVCGCGCNDEMFLKRYVLKHDDKKLVAELMAIFSGKKSKTNKASE